jgi:hypothetical protein
MQVPRFTIRWMMVLVASVGLTLGSIAWLGRRSEDFRRTAKRHELALRGLYQPAANADGEHLAIPEVPYGPRYDYHAALKQKYERAARNPWLPVEPDPPEPRAERFNAWRLWLHVESNPPRPK